MKKNLIRLFFFAGIVGALLVFLTAIPSKTPGSTGIVEHAYAETKGCGTQTLRGAYIYSGDGFVAATPGQAPFTPIAEAGVYMFDGTGRFSTTNTLSFGGQIIPRNDRGTYSVNSDCTGSGNSEGGVSFNFAVTRSGSEMRFVASIPGVSVMGTMTR